MISNTKINPEKFKLKKNNQFLKQFLKFFAQSIKNQEKFFLF